MRVGGSRRTHRKAKKRQGEGPGTRRTEEKGPRGTMRVVLVRELLVSSMLEGTSTTTRGASAMPYVALVCLIAATHGMGMTRHTLLSRRKFSFGHKSLGTKTAGASEGVRWKEEGTEQIGCAEWKGEGRGCARREEGRSGPWREGSGRGRTSGTSQLQEATLDA